MGSESGASRYADIQVAFQAISNIHSGQCFGYEVLVRGWERFGYASVEALLGVAGADGTLEELERTVRGKAGEFARQLPSIGERVLFFNLDPSIGGAWPAVTDAMRRELQPVAAQLVTEIAAFPKGEVPDGWASTLKSHGGMLAIDRFGATADGLHLVADCDPDFIKIDRSLVRGIERSARKRVMLAQMVGMAHTLGIEVIAVGVETGPELTVCRELGCDLVQGHLVQPPMTDVSKAVAVFPHLDALARDDRRRRQIDQKWVLQQLEALPAVRVDTPLKDVFERFGRNATTVIPVVDHAGRALGILHERNLKGYAYSAFGRELMSNPRVGRTLHEHMVRCPMADIATPLDQMLAIYSTAEDADGILVTEQMIYRGFLSARSIIRAMHEKTLTRARDENPLTKLPGNALITGYVAGCLTASEVAVMAYVDFDNFKPFNDIYGFRQGDRAILLFAELATKAAAQAGNWFVGHIGGDDFFIGLKGCSLDEAATAIGDLIFRFASDAESFYDAAARERRSITAQDREGNVKTFPLLAASAVLLALPPEGLICTVDDVSTAIAAKKKEAKASPTKLAFATLSSQ